MSATTIYRLGGLAILLSTLFNAIPALMFFLSGQQPSVLGLTLGIGADVLIALGLPALFARQYQRGGILGLVGYVLTMLGVLYFVAGDSVTLGVLSGGFTDQQTAQVGIYNAASSILPWGWVLGVILLGISIYLARILPRYAGILLILVGILQPLTGPLDFTRPIYSIIGIVAWAWLGYALLMDRGTGSQEQPTT